MSASGEGLFICNEGNFQYGNATLSYYDPATKSVQNEVFYRSNAMKLGDVAQSMVVRDGIGWIVVNNSHVIFAIDRSGIVGPDGETHQGLFDITFLQTIPNLTVYAPATYRELHIQFEKLCYDTPNACAIRYPRGGEVSVTLPFKESAEAFEMFCGNPETLVVTYGRQIEQVLLAADRLEYKPSILKINRIVPLSDSIVELASNYQNVLFYEEGYVYGGVGSMLCQKLSEINFKGNFKVFGISNQFVKHAKFEEILAEHKLNAEHIYQTLKQYL